ncbi:Phosphatidylinositol 5-phosphate 4-kinase type-2 alpha [Chytridiales sp. JEL 0842]|nr:Phosphatidylinositol 5-phosphate 4-kinase type-2 alpha [Chytridiales sp. JEL 0842]
MSSRARLGISGNPLSTSPTTTEPEVRYSDFTSRINTSSTSTPRRGSDPAVPTVKRSSHLLNTPTEKSRTIPFLERHHFQTEQVYDWLIPGFGRVKFIDHAPLAFKTVRARFGISVDEVEEALSMACKAEMSVGKSESVFFYTHNNRFLFKTLRGSEPENLKQFLPEYISHISKYPDTLLPRYLGLYTFEPLTKPSSSSASVSSNSQLGGGGEELAHIMGMLSKSFTVVLMSSVLDTDLKVQEKYDFKGSTVGRQTLNGNILDSSFFKKPASDKKPMFSFKAPDHHATTTTFMDRLFRSPQPSTAAPQTQVGDLSTLTLKELDFQNLLTLGLARKLHLGPEMKRVFLEQLEKDVGVLKRNGFMDYSVLVGVYRAPKPPPPLPPVAPPSVGLMGRSFSSGWGARSKLKAGKQGPVGPPSGRGGRGIKRPVSLAVLFGQVSNLRRAPTPLKGNEEEDSFSRRAKSSPGVRVPTPTPVADAATIPNSLRSHLLEQQQQQQQRVLEVSLDGPVPLLGPSMRRSYSQRPNGRPTAPPPLATFRESEPQPVKNVDIILKGGRKEASTQTLEKGLERKVSGNSVLESFLGGSNGVLGFLMTRTGSAKGGGQTPAGSVQLKSDVGVQVETVVIDVDSSPSTPTTTTTRDETSLSSSSSQLSSSTSPSPSPAPTPPSLPPPKPQPFHKTFHNGLQSLPNNTDSFEIEYEVYFIGLIDTLQKFNLVKWIERGLVHTTTARSRHSSSSSFSTATGGGSVVAAGYGKVDGGFVQEDVQCGASDVDGGRRRGGAGSVENFLFEVPEVSVEEPGRYAARLLRYMDAITV